MLRLRRGERPLGPAEAARLAPVLGLTADDLIAANPAPPYALLAVASRPQRRPEVVALARAKSISEDEAFTRAIFDAYAMAARASGDIDSAEAWEARLDRYFQMILDA